MEIQELHGLFLECKSISTDTRKITQDAMFFALKGDNFNGNSYAEQALNLGAKYVIIDEEQFKTSSKTILVNNVLETLQQLASFHRDLAVTAKQLPKNLLIQPFQKNIKLRLPLAI